MICAKDAQTNNAIDMNLIFSICSFLQKNNIIFKEKLMFKFETLFWEEKFRNRNKFKFSHN